MKVDRIWIENISVCVSESGTVISILWDLEAAQSENDYSRLRKYRDQIVNRLCQ